MARDQGKRVPTLTLETEVRFSSPARQAAFAQELTACIAELAQKYHDESGAEGRRFRFTIAGHPALPPENPSGEAESQGGRKHDA